MNNIAIIPARGGSKRIPEKNIKDFLGKPIISYSIEAALKSGLFSEVMVSTDDKEIADIARSYNAKVPFLRSKTNASDHVGIADVLVEVLDNYKKEGKEFDNVCCILATAPFVESKHLAEAFDVLRHSPYDAVFPIVRYAFPIQRAMVFDEGKKIKMIWPENMNKRSQDLDPSFHDAGLFYWVKYDVIVEQKRLWTDNTTAIEISEQVAQDIDTPEDWEFAELKYKIIHARK